MIPITGQSYQLAARKVAAQATINMYLSGVEVPDKAPFYLDSAPGMVAFSTPTNAESRASIEVGGRFFNLVGSTLFEVFNDGTSVSRGTITSGTGVASMAYGLFQLVIVDGTALSGWVLTLATNTFTQITDPAFYGSVRVRYLNGRFLFIRPGTQQFYWSAIDNALVFDALDFASAESNPDLLLSLEVSHEEAWLFGPLSIEVWSGSTNGDTAFVKNPSASIESGCVSPYAIVKADNTLYWIGKDSNGAAVVYKTQGYTPQRVSTHAIEQALQLSPSLDLATAYAYQDTGLTFVAFNAPGLTSTWVYEVSTNAWHQRCDLDPASGQFIANRAVNHCYVFNKHIVGSASGALYSLSKTAYTNAGSELVRERVTPHTAIPGRLRMFFRNFWLDCTTGESTGAATQVEISWSDDSGGTWSDPVLRSIGAIGERFARVLVTLCGSARDRLWKIRYSGNTPFAIVDGGADMTQGRA